MGKKTISLPVRDFSGENRELIICYEIILRGKEFMSSKCFYCKERKLKDVAVDTLIIHKTCRDKSQPREEEHRYMRQSAEKTLKNILNLERRKYCKKEQCLDKHFDFFNSINVLVKNSTLELTG